MDLSLTSANLKIIFLFHLSVGDIDLVAKLRTSLARSQRSHKLYNLVQRKMCRKMALQCEIEKKM